LSLDFPSRPPEPCPSPPTLAEALGAKPLSTLRSRDLMAVFDDTRVVRDLKPDFGKIAELDVHAVIVTAPGQPGGGVDFVSRFFAPRGGIKEDPVTGSSHCSLTPYWAERLGKTSLSARQLSARGGALELRLENDRVHIAGKVVPYLDGWITV